MVRGMIDLSEVIGRKRVIICDTQSDADELYKYIARVCPGYRRSAKIKAEMWRRYKNDTVYHIHELTSTHCDTDYCYSEYYRERGFEVVPYQTLIRGNVDLGVFESDGADILSLFNT